MGATIGKECCDEFEANSDSTQPWLEDVEVDSNGCRKFPRLPPPGTHPRLLFTKEEIPALRARMKHPVVWDKLYKVFDASKKCFHRFEARVDELNDEERSEPSESTIRDFFQIDETRNTGLLGALLWGFVKDDAELMNKIKDMVVFYSRVVRGARELALSQEITEKPFDFWHTKNWDVNSPWLTGGASFAFLYDVLFNDMNEDERAVVRGALSDTCQRRKSWGMEYAARRIQSNWGPYGSSHLIMNLALENEEGFDDDRVVKFENLMMQYLDFAFYPDTGHPIEDAYALNLGFREGSYSLMVLARRGLNLFNHPHFKKCFTKWLPFALEPGNSGCIYGGSSGSFFGYPTSVIIAKYVFPFDPIIDFVYRSYISEDGNKYSRLTKVQSRFPVMLFGIPALDDDIDLDEQAAKLGLPLDFNCHNRGKMILRSDWSSNAISLTLDARPDAFFIGHDSPSRGHFVMYAHGRPWGACGEWNSFTQGTDYSVPTIDGSAQQDKATSVHPLGVRNCGAGASMAAADLTYAYNYTWTKWNKEGDSPGDEWEEEPHDPRDFGMNLWWLPSKLCGERRVAFEGLHKWRKKISDVKRVTRSALLVRGDSPFVVITDRVEADDSEQTIAWNMVLPMDVTLDSSDSSEAVLKENDGGRSLVVRAVGLEGEFKVENIEGMDRQKKVTTLQKLTFEVSADSVDFRMLLYPLAEEGSMAESEWDEDSAMTVTSAEGETRTITFGTGARQEITMIVE